MRIVSSDEGGIAEAGAVLRGGGLVAFPTETVYGLGADAFNADAVRAIYAAKGRPGDNPLILHVSDRAGLESLAAELPDYAMLLAEAFWPGPLTLVVRKKVGLPPWLGGHPGRACETVGVRMPAHPVALAVIKAAGCVIAAPSANKAGAPSPTRAAHVMSDYQNAPPAPDLLVDGGPVSVGVESTVVDVTGDVPMILRPGAVTAEMLLEAVGILDERDTHVGEEPPPRSPGMKYRHYAPKAPMTVLCGTPASVSSYILARAAERPKAHIGVLLTRQSGPAVIARSLFDNLRRFDVLGVDEIYAEALEPVGLGAAIMDRMTKAAEGRKVETR